MQGTRAQDTTLSRVLLTLSAKLKPFARPRRTNRSALFRDRHELLPGGRRQLAQPGSALGGRRPRRSDCTRSCGEALEVGRKARPHFGDRRPGLEPSASDHQRLEKSFAPRRHLLAVQADQIAERLRAAEYLLAARRAHLPA